MLDQTPTDLRSRILQSSLRLFSTQGYDTASMRDIAGELGVAVATIYHHFPSKEAVLIAIVRDGYDEINTSTDVRTDHAAVLIEELVATTVGKMRSMHDFGRMARFDRAAIFGAMQDEYRVGRTVILDRLVSAIETGQQAGTIRPDLPARAAALMITGFWNWMPDWCTTDDLANEELDTQMARIAVAGMDDRSTGSTE